MADAHSMSLSGDSRAQAGYLWFSKLRGYSDSWRMQLLFADASFRRYFRLDSGSESLVLLDSPTDLEPLDPFVKIAVMWRKQNIYVPEILAWDSRQGFALIEDLGDKHLESLEQSEVPGYYRRAIDQLVLIQGLKSESLPVFDSSFVHQELSLLSNWTAAWLEIKLSADERLSLDQLCQWLVQQIVKQPYFPMHRDYHCRNLMIHNDRLAVIDFQGAMMGPWCYDLMSLLADAYRDLSEEQTRQLQDYYLARCNFALGHEELLHDFMCVQLQRHIKIIGLFCRLLLRDGKDRYIRFMPRVCRYIVHAAEHLLAGDASLEPALQTINRICRLVKQKASGYKQKAASFSKDV